MIANGVNGYRAERLPIMGCMDEPPGYIDRASDDRSEGKANEAKSYSEFKFWRGKGKYVIFSVFRKLLGNVNYPHG